MNKALLLTAFLFGIGTSYVGVQIVNKVKSNIEGVQKKINKSTDCPELAKEAFLCRIRHHNKQKSQ